MRGVTPRSARNSTKGKASNQGRDTVQKRCLKRRKRKNKGGQIEEKFLWRRGIETLRRDSERPSNHEKVREKS